MCICPVNFVCAGCVCPLAKKRVDNVACLLTLGTYINDRLKTLIHILLARVGR